MRKFSQRRLGLKRPNRGIMRHGFTLVELLVVMTIIGVLVGLITVAIFHAMRFVKNAEHFAELTKLDAAMRLFSERFGEQRYPPDGTGDATSLKKFVKLAFPNRKKGAAQVKSDLNPATSLVYWLSQISTDRTDPFKEIQGDKNSDGTDASHQFMKFNPAMLRNGMYYPPGSEIGHPPIIYFHHVTYDKASYRHDDGSFKPYYFASSGKSSSGSRGGREFASPDTFQIISCGLDGKLGTGGQLIGDDAGAGGDFIAIEDEDNKVNFDSRNVGKIRK